MNLESCKVCGFVQTAAMDVMALRHRLHSSADVSVFPFRICAITCAAASRKCRRSRFSAGDSMHMSAHRQAQVDLASLSLPQHTRKQL
jgi:hypothetical protein